MNKSSLFKGGIKMPFKKTPQTFTGKIGTVEIGADNKMVLGGNNIFPFYTFDAEEANAPKIGAEVSDLMQEEIFGTLKDYYEGCSTLADYAKKAEAIEGVDFICLHLEAADPNGENKSVEDCVAEAVEVEAAITKPLVIAGCKNNEKDAELFTKIAEALEGKNVLFMSAKEENYKQVGVSVVQAYGNKLSAESAVDINLAKQLNVLLTQLGITSDKFVMNLGSAAAGYGFEYVVSTFDRVKSAALGQNDTALQIPVITPVAFETWNVKEAVMPEEDMPEWGSREVRAINMEVVTAAACLAAGSDAVILRHPKTISTVSTMVKELL